MRCGRGGGGMWRCDNGTRENKNTNKNTSESESERKQLDKPINLRIAENVEVVQIGRACGVGVHLQYARKWSRRMRRGRGRGRTWAWRRREGGTQAPTSRGR